LIHLEGGAALNIVPEDAEIAFRLYFRENKTPKLSLKKINSILRSIERDDEVKFNMRGLLLVQDALEGVIKRGRRSLISAADVTVSLSDLTGKRKELTNNVGAIEMANSQDRAVIRFNTRIKEMDDHDFVLNRLDEIIEDISTTRSANIESYGDFAALPLSRGESNTKVFDAFERTANAFGFDIGRQDSGGVSDANHISALVPYIIDGLGPVGGKTHTHDEYLEIDSLVPRTQMTVLYLLGYARAHLTPEVKRGINIGYVMIAVGLIGMAVLTVIALLDQNLMHAINKFIEVLFSNNGSVEDIFTMSLWGTITGSDKKAEKDDVGKIEIREDPLDLEDWEKFDEVELGMSESVRKRWLDYKLKRIELIAKYHGKDYDLVMHPTKENIWAIDYTSRPYKLRFPYELLEKKSVKAITGVTLHEASHRDITWLDKWFSENGNRHWLLNVIEDTRIENWAMVKSPASKKYIKAFYDETLEENKIKDFDKAGMSLPIQYGMGVIYRWTYGKEHPGLKNDKVLEALDLTQDDVELATNLLPGRIKIEHIPGEEKLRISSNQEQDIYVRIPGKGRSVNVGLSLAPSLMQNEEGDFFITTIEGQKKIKLPKPVDQTLHKT